MELEFERETIEGWTILAEGTLCQEETQETIVPDACPDILRIVEVRGQALLGDKQVREGSGTVSGTVKLTVLYQPEGGGKLCRMEAAIPFQYQVEAAGLTPEGRLLACPRLRRGEARALNPRKVLLRVDLALEFTVCQPIHRELPCGVLDPEETGVCQRQSRWDHCYLAEVEEKPFLFQDQIRVKGGQGETFRLMDCRVQPLCTESRRMGNKLILKGTAECALLLLEGSGALTTCREALPFSQVLELVDSGEEGDSRVSVELSALRCAPDLDDRQCIQLELELLVQARVYRRRTVTVLRDLYSTARETECRSSPQLFCPRGETTVLPQSVRELLEVGETVHTVVDCTLCLGELTQRREGEELILRSEANLSILYLDGEEELKSAERAVELTASAPCSEGTRCSCHCLCPGEVYAAPAAGGIEVRFQAEFHCLMTAPREAEVISSAEVGEARGAGRGERPSMILRLAAPGEGLWDIAKACGTTMEQIIRANELEGEAVPAGTMLLIPGVR